MMRHDECVSMNMTKRIRLLGDTYHIYGLCVRPMFLGTSPQNMAWNTILIFPANFRILKISHWSMAPRKSALLGTALLDHCGSHVPQLIFGTWPGTDKRADVGRSAPKTPGKFAEKLEGQRNQYVELHHIFSHEDVVFIKWLNSSKHLL